MITSLKEQAELAGKIYRVNQTLENLGELFPGDQSMSGHLTDVVQDLVIHRRDFLTQLGNLRFDEMMEGKDRE